MKHIKYLLAVGILGLSSTSSFAIRSGDAVTESNSAPKGVASISAMDASGAQLSLCSGIFISDHILLTAKHCVTDGLPELTIIDAQALKAPILASLADVRISSKLDLAIVSFPANTAKVFTPVSDKSASPKDSLEVRGFGGNEDPEASLMPTPPPGEAIERFSHFELFAASGDDYIFRLHLTGTYAVEGDSGGPIFANDGKLTGILKTYEVLDINDEYGNEWVQNTAVSLATPTAQAFLKNAIADLAKP